MELSADRQVHDHAPGGVLLDARRLSDVDAAVFQCTSTEPTATATSSAAAAFASTAGATLIQHVSDRHAQRDRARGELDVGDGLHAAARHQQHLLVLGRVHAMLSDAERVHWVGGRQRVRRLAVRRSFVLQGVPADDMGHALSGIPQLSLRDV